MTNVNWNKTSKDNLPDHQQRILFYRPTKLTKVGEMVFREDEKDLEHFLDEVTHWAPKLEKPGESPNK